jgi:hypothetical protein
MMRRSLPAAVTAIVAVSFAIAAVVRAGTAASSPACATRNLVVWLDTNGDAGAGSVHYELEFTNLSRGSCTLRGYPGVSAVDLAGRQVGTAAAREAGNPTRTITLVAGGTASSALRIANTGVFPSSACHSTTAAGLRVYPPGQRASKIAPYPFRACSKAGTAYLHVRAATTETRP